MTAASGSARPLTVVDGAQEADGSDGFGGDRWHADVLGIDAVSERRSLSFEGISQPWLRSAVKAWCQWRLVTGLAWTSVHAFTSALNRFSMFLAAAEPDAADAAVITRPLLERYLAWLAGGQLAANSRSLTIISLRGFLELNQRHCWLPEIPATAMLYQDDLPARGRALPRFVPEFVMAQLEDDNNLALLDATTRHLVIVLMETGLRANDACHLPFNPLLEDSSGWPCLRFYARKVSEDQLVPLSGRAAAAIRDQQAVVRAEWPSATPWLFPDPLRRFGEPEPFRYSLLGTRLKSWQRRIGLHDEAGEPVVVTAHQFRHTVGTRLINAGVPQHVVQRLLGHASPGMTAVYARLHDSTIRAAFDTYQQKRVNLAGQVIAFDPAAPTADAEWIKHNLARVQAVLPNGYCGRPPQQDCPHPNACLTCPDFQTTVEFLPAHRAHADRNRRLIAVANSNGQFRLAENHRKVQASLDTIITSLEQLEAQRD